MGLAWTSVDLKVMVIGLRVEMLRLQAMCQAARCRNRHLARYRVRLDGGRLIHPNLASHAHNR